MTENIFSNIIHQIINDKTDILVLTFMSLLVWNRPYVCLLMVLKSLIELFYYICSCLIIISIFMILETTQLLEMLSSTNTLILDKIYFLLK